MNPLSVLGNFGRGGTHILWFCEYWLTDHVSPCPIVRKDTQIQLMRFGQGSQWEGELKQSCRCDSGQMRGKAAVASTVRYIMELMCYMTVHLCPISAIQGLPHVEQ